MRISVTYLVNEDKCDQSGKVFLREPRDVAHESASVDRHEDYQNQCYPRADPEAERHVVPIWFPANITIYFYVIHETSYVVRTYSLAKFVDYRLED